MRCVTLDLRHHNNLSTAWGNYFVFCSLDGRLGIVEGRCPHRGGPLQLGCRDVQARSVVCPWHGSKVSEEQMLRTSLPMVRVGHIVRVILPRNPGSDVSASWRLVTWGNCNTLVPQTSRDVSFKLRHIPAEQGLSAGSDNRGSGPR
jgi:hypothetical protein